MGAASDIINSNPLRKVYRLCGT